jgi:hypothetical protein
MIWSDFSYPRIILYAILFSAIFYAKYTDLKTIVRCHSTGLVQSKPGTFSPDRRLSRPNLDPQGLPCLTFVQPNLTCPTHSPGIQSLDLLKVRFDES